ncbi:probable inactive receptor kinase At5g10020 [Beta vulgaris subsp. vulgaris]|uniref:probable inactive receptor kinase At5g10020 n=1 Tax=Beta vulgaris subsp. vulgaris TaxID=3555 RepID=UPI002036F7AA|nr:probable inactive receptor kinase At5g10020 [Beta vulgaris subsp. vulgaris]
MQSFCLVMFFWVQITFGSSDFNALLELKKGITKDSMRVVLDSWNAKSVASDGCPQKWDGVSCRNGNVESIMLNDAGLIGVFDFKTISSLKMLRNLSISNNQLSGDLLEISYLESLENLDLSRNSFQGVMPSNFTKLKNLVYANLSTNNFEGLVPSVFLNLKELKYLDLHSNRFSGDAMKLVSELGGLSVLDLSCNQFSGQLDIGLGRPSFVSNIQVFNVSQNALAGELFSHDGVPYFDNLEVFDASYNQLNGTIPAFNFVVSLRVLRLGSNLLSGALPEALLQDSSMVLSELDLSLNQLEGPVGSITSTSLRSLNLSSNQFSGSLPLRTGNCVIIDLSNNNFSGNLSRTRYWGNYIEVVQLSSNSLTGVLPNKTSQFLRLTSLRASNNSLEGSLSSIFGIYPELKVIDLSFNMLSGSLPSLSNWTKVTSVNLSHNNISGIIPLQAGVGDLASYNFSLVSLDLSHNIISSDFPIELSNFHNLQYLDMSSNNFMGTIPSNLSEQLTGLNVSYNNFSGIVPRSLRRFTDASFYPGNSLLIFPDSPSSRGSNASMNSKSHHHSRNQALIASILAGLIGGVVILVLLLLIIYYRIHVKKHSIKDQIGQSETKDNKSWTSSLPSTSPSLKSIDPSLNSPRSGQGALTSKMGPTAALGSSTSNVTKCKDLSPPESTRIIGEISSPVTIISSSNPSLAKGQNLFQNLGAVKIGSPDKLAGDLHLFDGSLVFTAEQLSLAPAEVIGRSCHGMLYRAALENGHMLVVKRLKEGIAIGRKEFAREAKKLGNVRHPNLVSLQGYYWGPRQHEKLVISNYINAPCLGIYLQGQERSQIPSLSLQKRFKAARVVAQCLDYLHNERAIPHGNLKSSNILIHPSEASVFITDYGLHRLLTPAGTADQVLNAGALGYLPPEFINSSKPCPSLKSDVYAFGVILLELLTGRSSAEIVSANQGAVDLTDWVKMLVVENRANECFDKAVFSANIAETEYRSLDRMLQVALRCILPASERPDTRTVLHDLTSLEQ